MIYDKNSKINDYLFFGYTLEPFSFDWLANVGLNEDDLNDFSDDALAALFLRVIDDCFPEEDTFNKCIVPLSGGWDSRLLLGAALDKYAKSKIIAVTYGAPGQLDYELGKLIAKECGINHVAYDLNKEIITWNKLVNSVRLSPWTYVPDGFYNQRMLELVSESSNDIVLSGFMGDPLTGGHIGDSQDSKSALVKFIAKQKKIKTVWLPESEYTPIVKMCPESLKSPLFDYDEHYDIAIRQSKCIAPIVTFRRSCNSWNTNIKGQSKLTMITPFSDERWASFWCRTPKENKVSQKQYLNLILNLYPDLYKLPSKINYGVSFDDHAFILFSNKLKSKFKIMLNKFAPKLFVKNKAPINYIDFDEAFRKREDFKEVLDMSISYLKSSNAVPWLDLDEMKLSHLNNNKNFGDALLVLIGLAVNLYAEANDD